MQQQDAVAGEYFVELRNRRLTNAERVAFGISDVEPIAGLQSDNAGIDIGTWTGTPEPELAAPQAYPSPLQANVPTFDESAPAAGGAR